MTRPVVTVLQLRKGERVTSQGRMGIVQRDSKPGDTSTSVVWDDGEDSEIALWALDVVEIVCMDDVAAALAREEQQVTYDAQHMLAIAQLQHLVNGVRYHAERLCGCETADRCLAVLKGTAEGMAGSHDACPSCRGAGGRHVPHPYAEGRYVDLWVECECVADKAGHP